MKKLHEDTKTDENLHAPISEEVPPSAFGGFDLGLNFIISILICAGGGYWLDKWLGTLPLFMLVGSLLGFVAGLYVIWQKFK